MENLFNRYVIHPFHYLHWRNVLVMLSISSATFLKTAWFFLIFFYIIFPHSSFMYSSPMPLYCLFCKRFTYASLLFLQHTKFSSSFSQYTHSTRHLLQSIWLPLWNSSILHPCYSLSAFHISPPFPSSFLICPITCLYFPYPIFSLLLYVSYSITYFHF